MKPEFLMEKLNISYDEALQVIADDKAIDKGEKLFELTADQKQAVKIACRADSKPHTTKSKRERVTDPVKECIISLLIGQLTAQSMVTDLEVANDEREFTFKWDGRKFKVVLSCPRS